MSRNIILVPRISEKTYQMSQRDNIYVFDVSMYANKEQIKRSVSKQFKVAVESVNVSVKKGKVKNSTKRRLAPKSGKEANTKRCYIKLKQGDKIPLFEDA